LRESQKYPKSKKFAQALCKHRSKMQYLPINSRSNNFAGVGEFPFQATLGYLSSKGNSINYRCEGSLIADDIVLTAAHCANNRYIPKVVKLGRVRL